jgi:hypothetical protein
MKRYGNSFLLFRFLNEIHAILRLYAISCRIRGYDRTRPFFRMLYIKLRCNGLDDTFPAPSIAILRTGAFKTQLSLIRGHLDLYAGMFDLEYEYADVRKLIRKLDARLTHTKQKKLDEFFPRE